MRGIGGVGMVGWGVMALIGALDGGCKCYMVKYNSRRKSKTFISRDLRSRLPKIVLYE